MQLEQGDQYGLEFNSNSAIYFFRRLWLQLYDVDMAATREWVHG
jgi:hypothetical protein